MQGGGALGAYHLGVYEALHRAGIEPDWVIGTSIGAINAALIAGNVKTDRLARLDDFWRRIEQVPAGSIGSAWPAAAAFAGSLSMPWAAVDPGLARYVGNLATLARGIPNFFEPNPALLAGVQAPIGVESASYYRTAPLRHTLAELLDTERIAAGPMRMTVGAVHVTSGAMRYFDSRTTALTLDHVMASGALPPAFGAVRIDGEPYWDGGLYSNTPIEAVLDDRPRRSSLIFDVNVWHPTGPEPESVWQVMNRQKDIQYASRADSQLLRHKQIHRLRHVIRELTQQLPPKQREQAGVQALAAYGCATTMHVAHLLAPVQDGEDATKDIDFSAAGIAARRAAGLADAERMLQRAPWDAQPDDPAAGVIEHF
ncbi:MAG: patatin-like phospholipase family protein [Rubrivivax sp.]